MKLEGAIFDLDGTLTDSMYIWDQAPRALVHRYGGQPPEDLAQTIKEMGRREASEYMIHSFRLNCAPEEMMEGVNDLVTQAYRTEVPMKQGADQLLARLSLLGVPCAVATASEAFQAQDALTRLGLWKHFAFALSSIQYGPKTGPGIYLEAARRLGSTPENTVVFEDALHAARAAKQGGFLVAGVYDPSAEGDQEELKQVSDWYLPSLDQFLAQLT
ncbi:MAG: HAD family hydrolase [Lawsonibacter sp.]